MIKKKEFCGINIETDGIYCDKCNCLHPTLFWHNKYDDYLIKEDRVENLKKYLEKHNIKLSIDQLEDEFNSLFKVKKIKLSRIKGSCIMCGKKTKFKNLINSQYICSDECFYKYESTRMKVKYIGTYSSPLGLITGNIYECVGQERGSYRVIDETDEDYLYPIEDFEIIEE